jgi:hypothetical protein
MNEESLGRLDEILTVATRQLLEANNLTIEPAEAHAPDPAPSYAASIGFTSDMGAGALVLVVPQAIVRRSFPQSLQGADANQDQLTDWAGELANQLLGRLKNKLIPHGLEIHLSIPIVVLGCSMEHGRATPAILRRLHFAQQADNFSVVFQSSALEKFEIGELDASQETTVAEGELELF